jgi:RNA polymerase sigma factor (sigma-70 family)
MDNLEECVHVYQESHSSEALDEVVEQMDGLVLSVVHQMLRSYRGNLDLEFDDLYQIGIIGLMRALASLPKDFDADVIRMKVVAYIKAEMRSKFRAARRRASYQRKLSYGDDSVSDEDMYRKVEVKELFNLLIEKGVITREDFYLLYHRYVDEISVRELAKHYGKTMSGIVYWEQNVLNRIRHDITVREYEDADL